MSLFLFSYGLLGPSGCGKTTLLRCILGRLKLAEGHVMTLGRSPGSRGHSVPGADVGYMPQVGIGKRGLDGEHNGGREEGERKLKGHLIALGRLPAWKSRSEPRADGTGEHEWRGGAESHMLTLGSLPGSLGHSVVELVTGFQSPRGPHVGNK